MQIEHLRSPLRLLAVRLPELHDGRLSCKDNVRLELKLMNQRVEGAVGVSGNAAGAFRRYNMYGNISMRAAEEMRKKEVRPTSDCRACSLYR